MYKVYYYLHGPEVYSRSFDTFTKATDFAIEQNRKVRESIIEIKHYADIDTRKPERN